MSIFYYEKHITYEIYFTHIAHNDIDNYQIKKKYFQNINLPINTYLNTQNKNSTCFHHS